LLPVPYVEQLADRYFPASLSSKDYPKLLQEGAAVDTLSVGTVLGAYNGEFATSASQLIRPV
jgi:uncharacterized protein